MTELPDVEALLAEDWLEREFAKLEAQIRQRYCLHEQSVEITCANDPVRTFLCVACGLMETRL